MLSLDQRFRSAVFEGCIFFKGLVSKEDRMLILGVEPASLFLSPVGLLRSVVVGG